jgi:hypothetical protein
MRGPRRTILTLMLAGLIALGGMAGAATRQSPAAPAGLPGFLEPNRCYRFTFAIQGAPAYRVLELLDGGWIKATVDAGAGPPAPPPQPLWINSAQIVSVREARCSG